MACHDPLGFVRTENRGVQIYRDRATALMTPDSYGETRCGQCLGCRSDRARDWALRAYAETHTPDPRGRPVACFITLTYDEDWRPADGSLRPEDFTNFAKRLRRFTRSHVRYLQCGEYGASSMRPHHHAIVWGEDFRSDRRIWKISGSQRTYLSESLSNLWGRGFTTVAPATFANARYVAGYVLKKLQQHRWWELTAEWDGNKVVSKMAPPYVTMSRNPGLGRAFFDAYWRDMYPKDFLTVEGRKYRPPFRFDEWLRETQPVLHDQVVEKRRAWAAEQPPTSEATSRARKAIYDKNPYQNHRSKI